LDEVSAMFGESMLFRKNMLEEYAKQLEQWKQEGKDPKDFQFSALEYALETGGATLGMTIWYDTYNDFAGLMSGMSQAEAAQLVSCYFDVFSNMFDNYREGMNRIFDETLVIPTSFDTEEFFQKALNGMFTCQIDGKEVSVLELMAPAAKAGFLAKLNAKMEEELEKWLHAVSVTGVMVSPATMTLRVGEYGDIHATLLPENSNFKNTQIHWSSSDNSIVSISLDNGDAVVVVLAKAPGAATMTARTSDGDFTATCVVTVTQ
jgi:hypothetical protein